MTHLRVRLLEIITDHAAFVCINEDTQVQILQLAYELTADLDATSLLEFSKEVLPADLHTQVRAFLADKYPILLAAAESDLTVHAGFAAWTDFGRDDPFQGQVDAVYPSNH